MIGRLFIPALVIAVAWMLITGRVEFESFVVGIVLGLILSIANPRKFEIPLRRVPSQAFALIVYVVILARDIILSGVDVARRVLSPTMPLNPGIIAVETQDEAHSPLIAALSADVITLTPGELVVEVEDNHVLYVHCLDVEASTQHADDQQSRRLALFNRILGRSS